ncbi:G protein-coupled receptor 184 [Xyrichtys novacula]|uniref:G protein-coupled receptor 184 n=1 Tax=Xyrichtys novacula TaxID=13765 RepID=A0AAV1FWH9_XYRNO|nr:G protein-coupled receptor 184 [Xyrichtys novacula]
MDSTVTPQANTTNLTLCVRIGDDAISDFLMCVYILAFIFGLIFNVITLGPIWLQMRRGNILGIFLLSLSISDMLFLFTIPLWINYYYKNHNWQLGVDACSVAGFFYYSNMYISIYLLCCISLDRCLAVTLPHRSKAFRTSRYAWVLCICVYVVVAVLHFIVLIKDDLKGTHDNKNENDRCYETYPIKRPMALFNLVRVGFGFLLPLMVLAVSYWKVLATVDQRPGLSAQMKRKVRLLSYGVIGIFSVCYAPYHILLLVRSLVFYNSENQEAGGSYCDFEQKMHFVFSCSLALSSLNCVVDPVLYVLVSNGFQEDIKQFWRWHRNTRTDDTSPTANSRRKANADLI